ncbi:ROK family glucokinase [Chengkuizengella sediminis]|uniref:ROK family glucokinase n=1 Tax=Chengkuizengella sediminis TaxID=1885917 RepID=UPI0013895C6A|nr:ROK family glucokinase [Chengkuizengella sediminis]NDI36568.1 ROK family glucokinase [Chengkuizengella sediminis]
MLEQIYIGVDLGGTTVKVGICDSKGKLIQTYEGPTESEGGYEQVTDNITTYVKKIVEDSTFSWDNVAGIGAGIAGFVDKNGLVKRAANLGWENVHVKNVLEEKTGKPVIVNNDANVAALGEVWSGAGAGVSDVICYTLGTGVGGGIIIEDKIHQGFNGMAGEIGHMSVVPDLEAIQCGCGQKGCLETVSSATGIIRMAKDAVERGERTSLSLLDTITAKDVFDAARVNDEVSIRIVMRAAYYLGRSMSMLAFVLNPQRFIVGGGVSKAGDILFDQIQENFEKFTPDAIKEGVDIVPATLGNDAGIVGAAGLNLFKI